MSAIEKINFDYTSFLFHGETYAETYEVRFTKLPDTSAVKVTVSDSKGQTTEYARDFIQINIFAAQYFLKKFFSEINREVWIPELNS